MVSAMILRETIQTRVRRIVVERQDRHKAEAVAVYPHVLSEHMIATTDLKMDVNRDSRVGD